MPALPLDMREINGLVPSMQAYWYRHEVLANNLANLSTPGFKRDDIAVVPRAPAGGGPDAPAVFGLAPWTDFSQGMIRATGRSLDLALNGPGFFVVETPAGPRYTRAGAFALNRDGYLATADGAPVLGERGPILIQGDRIVVGGTGEIRRDGRLVDRLRVVEFPAGERLQKEGHSLFAPISPTAQPTPARAVEVVGEALEGSNVNAVQTMVSMMDSLRKYEAAQRAIQSIEEANKLANTQIGTV